MLISPESVAIACLEMQLINKFKLYFVLFTSVMVFISATVFAADDCSSCHEEVKAKSRRGRIVHAPVMKGQCSQCHIAGKAVSAPVKKSPLAVEKEQAAKIRWFQTLSNREPEHWLRLPAERLSAGLFLKATDGRMRTPVEKISLPAKGSLALKVDDKKAPQQSNLQVTGVRRGISTTATLQWETDEHTESVVYYGIKNLRSMKSDRNLSRRHSQVLLGLQANKNYQYQVVSRDLFGNEVKSQIMTFSTDNSFWDQDESYSTDNPFSSEIDLRWDLSRVEDDFLLTVVADRPVSISIGVQNKKKSQTTQERAVAVTDRFSHPILKSSFDTNITVCKSCHLNVQEEYSHPIKVKAKRGMIIPADYPVLSDGTMSCMTCHDKHASNNDYRLRKSKKSDLCRGCHRNY